MPGGNMLPGTGRHQPAWFTGRIRISFTSTWAGWESA